VFCSSLTGRAKPRKDIPKHLMSAWAQKTREPRLSRNIRSAAVAMSRQVSAANSCANKPAASARSFTISTESSPCCSTISRATFSTSFSSSSDAFRTLPGKGRSGQRVAFEQSHAEKNPNKPGNLA